MLHNNPSTRPHSAVVRNSVDEYIESQFYLFYFSNGTHVATLRRSTGKQDMRLNNTSTVL